MRCFPHLVLNHLGGSPVTELALELTMELAPETRSDSCRNLQADACSLDARRAGTGTAWLRNFHRQIEPCLR